MELLKKYGPLVLIVIGPLLVALVAILAPEMFDRVVESLGLLFGGIASGLGMATVRRRPKTGDSDAGFITLQALVLILAAAMLITLLAGCPGPTRCPDNDKIAVVFRTSAPSLLTARCSSEDFDRVELGSRRELELFATCPTGTLPVATGQQDVNCGGKKPCTRSRVKCVAVAP